MLSLCPLKLFKDYFYSTYFVKQIPISKKPEFLKLFLLFCFCFTLFVLPFVLHLLAFPLFLTFFNNLNNISHFPITKILLSKELHTELLWCYNFKFLFFLLFKLINFSYINKPKTLITITLLSGNLYNQTL